MAESRLVITFDTDLDLSRRKTIAHALGALGCALSKHGHEWSDAERALYEDAHQALRSLSPTFLEPITSDRACKEDPCVGPHMGSGSAAPHLSDRELNERICQELQRMRDEIRNLRGSNQNIAKRTSHQHRGEIVF